MAIVQAAVHMSDAKSQLDEFLAAICEELQLTPSRYHLAVQRYGTINKLLEAKGSPFVIYSPRIYPQGSMALGTTVKPDDGPHDLDFVMELHAWNLQIRPMELLHALHEFFKGFDTYKNLTTLKNRCVRLEYADDFYLDILPACKDVRLGGTCISVPDRAANGWSPSNPEGFLQWFKRRSAVRQTLMDKAMPIPAQQSVDEKMPLQLGVQLLKRARDVYFGDSDFAPISVVLTTLAATHYAGENSVSTALTTVLAGIVAAINRADDNGRRIEVCNPSNQGEDFGERWDSNHQAYQAFRNWVFKLSEEWHDICVSRRNPADALEKLFGEYVSRAEVQLADRMQRTRKAGQLGVTSAGIITTAGSATRVQPNVFHGDE
jgi:Second Messenger Oligonucleotide or Dinucleotide Synthetase domain